jgi:glyoxylase-like metal-dependent hydrolase (beta-lactamase superfamily II)
MPVSMPDGPRLYPFDCGRLVATGVPFVHPSGEIERVHATFASACWLVAHPDGLLLWDAGMPDGWIVQQEGVLSASGGWRFHVTRTIASCLGDLGATLADVSHLAFSHLHLDHTGNANAFAGATVLVHEAELAVAFGDRPPPAYDPPSYATLRERRVVALQGDHDGFGDGSVLMLDAPGHSAGHQVLLLDLPETGPVVLSGDLYYGEGDRTTRRVAAWSHDIVQARRSMERIEGVVAARSARLLIGHDLASVVALSPGLACLS